MNCKYLCDSHVHSNNSFDAQNTMEEMCLRALELSMYAITFTDHCECDFYGTVHEVFGDFKKQVAQANEDVYKAINKFSPKLKVLRGIELGEPLQNTAAVDDIMSKYKYDFILGSIHNIKGYEDFFYLKYSYESVYLLLNQYFDEIRDMIKYCDFDSLAHLTYPLRYIVGKHQMQIDMSKFRDRTDEILELLVKSGRALEINTSGLRQEIHCTLPSAEYVKRYRSMGGKYITIGSDAHKCSDLAKSITEGMRIAYDCGFREFTLFENREPHLLPIE